MKPWRHLDSAAVPTGDDELQLWQRDTEFSIRLKRGGELMNSRAFGSERALATLVCERLRTPANPRQGLRILVGGLGLGHTLAAALADLPADAEVTVAELSPAVVRWNRGPLRELAGAPLDDPRARVFEGDVAQQVRSHHRYWDGILLDVDNGPEGLTREENDWLYSAAGLRALLKALRPGGLIGVWSAHASAPFNRRLRGTGARVEEVPVRARQGKRGSKHRVWLIG